MTFHFAVSESSQHCIESYNTEVQVRMIKNLLSGTSGFHFNLIFMLFERRDHDGSSFVITL